MPRVSMNSLDGVHGPLQLIHDGRQQLGCLIPPWRTGWLASCERQQFPHRQAARVQLARRRAVDVEPLRKDLATTGGGGEDR